MFVDLKGKTSLVTGAARGIGKQIARTLLENKSNLILVDIDEEKLKETETELRNDQVKISAYKLDISNFIAVQNFYQLVKREFESIDILVNNAGITRDNLIMRMSEDDWDKVIAVNLKGAFNIIKAVSRDMLSKRWGRIINISSVIGIMGNAGQANYAASKAGIIGLTKSLAKEFAKRNVLVNAIAPGFIETEMTLSLKEDIKKRYMEHIPMQRFGSCTDVANIVLFLVSESSNYITGQVINCDGGMVM
jgi:3-oxoacyl-[acyl-carrier protein] reductase